MKSDTAMLDDLQMVLARINDVPITHAVSVFHIGERARCAQLLQRELADDENEQVLLSELDDACDLSVYIDTAVIERLNERSPIKQLDVANLADFCTALEGISHFQYLIWCIEHQRQVSLLELELQAEVDKYAVAMWLLRHQGQHDLPNGGVCRQLFDAVSYVLSLPADVLARYRRANDCAARYCRRINRYLGNQRRLECRPELWLRSLQEFYRQSQHGKLRYSLV